ncbi:MAG TPA: hypothetical protein VI895_02585 [Bdellovibrionota bacterium]|nr:hypothetical protein [Bdellovibrionota bacterium]
MHTQPNQDYTTIARFLTRTIQFSTFRNSYERSLALVTDYLARTFHVGKDEVALLVLDRVGQELRFVAPDYLARLSATIPFGRRQSQAAICLWDQKARIENRFAAVNHLAYFEKVRRDNPHPHTIEKLLTYPVVSGSSPIGVVQISRKRTLNQATLPDFHVDDIRILEAIQAPLRALLQGIRSASSESTPAPELRKGGTQ